MMKTKIVLTLLLSLTLSLVAHMNPVTERDTGVTQEYPQLTVANPSFSVLQVAKYSEPVYMRTRGLTAITFIIIAVKETKVTIEPKMRDVDLCSFGRTNINKTISTRARNRTTHLHYDGGGGHGQSI